MEELFLLDTVESSPEYNMALDESMLYFSYKNKIPILRFYKWNLPTLSIGYFQKARETVNFSELSKKGFGFVRRPTGGRAVLHDKEITYCYIIKASELKNGGSVIESYKEISQFLISGFNELGIDLEYEKKQIENQFAEGKIADTDITAKAKELEVIIKKMEEKEERWFELSSKME